MKTLRLLPLLLAALLMLPSCRRSIEQRGKRFEKEIEPYREALHNVGLNVVVVEDNQIVYTHSFGYKNLSTLEPLTDSCLFRIASISKSFTTTSLLQLVEEGKLSLDDDVSNLAGFTIRNPHFPDIPITLEMLLSHTSSLCDDEGYFNLDVINPEVNPNWANCYRTYAPGKGYEYCNLNLNLAGSFLEKTSGERFDQAVKHRVLDPLGLYGGYCVDSLDRSRFASLYEEPEFSDMPIPSTLENGAQDSVSSDPYVAQLLKDFVCVDADAYAPRSEQIANYRFGYDTPVFSPTGGMKITSVDLARYMMMHMNYGTSPSGVRIISEESSRNMQTIRSSDENYCLTLWQTDAYSPGVTLVGHTGGAYGMRSAMFFNPGKKYGFVVISNGALENTPESLALCDPSGSAAGDENILTCTLRLLYRCFIGE